MRRFAFSSSLTRHARHSSRVFWLLLLAVHIPALVAVGGSVVRGEGAFSVISIVGLVLTVAFFVLKCMDVASLRLRGPGAKRPICRTLPASLHKAVADQPCRRRRLDKSGEAAKIAAFAGFAATGG